MRIEQLQMKLGKMGPPVLRRHGDNISAAAATAQLITAGGIGRTQRRIDAAKKIKAFLNGRIQKYPTPGE